MTRSAGLTLSLIAKAGFAELSRAREMLGELANKTGIETVELLSYFELAADPDTALNHTLVLADQGQLRGFTPEQWQRFCLVGGASPALLEFWQRNPQSLARFQKEGGFIPQQHQITEELKAAVADGSAIKTGAAGWNALRIRYRELLAAVVCADLEGSAAVNGAAMFERISVALSELAAGAIAVALEIARATLVAGQGNGLPIPAEHAKQAPLAIVAMGKCGAQELNVVSDVDVIFITDELQVEGALKGDALLKATTRLASETMRVIHDPAIEPPLWQLDANLRPEGKNGPLVRTLGSCLNYYNNWAQAWEFQALLKARAIAGDLAIGEAFVEATRPLVWASRQREDFVGSVQRMRERVTEYLDPEDVDYQIKLGPGGLRDVEFSVQLLQLVHGEIDESLRLRGTLESLRALIAGGYIARSDGQELIIAYSELRVLEHRLQLRKLQRTALMPRDEDAQRILARASGYQGASEMVNAWEHNKIRVRSLHLKIFYAPLLSAVAGLGTEEFVLTNQAAAERLSSIGFKDPQSALAHLGALTSGTSRRATIQRNLLPVLLQWLAQGADPDYGLVAFRRISDANAKQHWYLRLLRDGTEVAERLTAILSGSRFTADLLETRPESVAWLESDETLRPRSHSLILDEMRAVAQRREVIGEVAEQLRAIHRREILRLAMGRVVGVNDEAAVAMGLDATHSALLEVLLEQLQRLDPRYSGLEISLIALGRFGGQELGFSSDLDLIAVYRAAPERAEARRDAEHLVQQLKALVADPRFPVELDFDLRPEGKNGAFARTLEGYAAYYQKWSLTWEAQALLRARPIAGSGELGAEFIAIANTVRYPEAGLSETDMREIRLLKARMESERLPRGVEPTRHLKLGPGGISDTEWLVQLWQLQCAARIPEFKTTSTLAALEVAVKEGLCEATDAARLREAWRLASSLRSAEKLWLGRSTDVLSHNRFELEGIARILGLPPDHTTALEERWLTTARKARRVFEREFFGEGASGGADYGY